MPWRESAAELACARAEQPVVIPTPAGALYGIFTPPAPDVPAPELCAVLFTRPRSHRNRMWVEAARRLASHGFACFRFDYHGTGDSEGASSFLDPNHPYREDAVAVLRHLRAHFGQRRFVLSGLCFDARTALSAFMDEGDAIEGLVFVAAPVMELSTMMKVDADRRSWRQIGYAFLKPDNWQAMASWQRWKHVGMVLGRRLRRSVGQPQSEFPLSRTFLQHFEALVRSKARALFLYGEDDMEYETFRPAEHALFGRLAPRVRERFEVVIWPGAVHAGTLDVARQREILDMVVSWMLALRAGGARAPTRAASAGGDRRGGELWTSR
jgi:pimeloyl-ACP methyl ester carboxylesterase